MTGILDLFYIIYPKRPRKYLILQILRYAANSCAACCNPSQLSGIYLVLVKVVMFFTNELVFVLVRMTHIQREGALMKISIILVLT